MDKATRNEIEKTTWQTLRDAGLTKPPVRIEQLLEHLDLQRHFYDLRDPSFLDRAKHRIQIHGQKLITLIKKINLLAVLFNDENRIVIDANLPPIKRDWPSFHETTHRILKWHHPYFYGDTAQTLDPDWHERLEAEANYGTSALMFCGPVFNREARDTASDWASLTELKIRYGKSFVTTIRRYVEHGPDLPMALLISTPFWETKPNDQPERWRHFVTSPSFDTSFSVTPQALLAIVDINTTQHYRGIVGNFTCALTDDNDTRFEFRGESFYNTYYILTLFVQLHKLSTTRVVVPEMVRPRQTRGRLK